MGKYQLDNKGEAAIGKFHEKNSGAGGIGSKAQNVTKIKITELREKMKKKGAK
ncbi:hypothetical protein [Lactovum miscens]|uniref:Uncharacterized protein n=1 Tax=Lactovum miscens TaxID=190387 RepID=A0A841C9X8_9LACT|nr:hypothetical protein [Lactovum miscens]MBB5888199.1 hypothetical protein [Lactovum miscens]